MGMSRTKQTAPKSTGGKAPRLHIATMAARFQAAQEQKRTATAADNKNRTKLLKTMYLADMIVFLLHL
jgi:hypothetical protein